MTPVQGTVNVTIKAVRAPRRALVIAAHPDDETIGAGGTMAKLAGAGWDVRTLYVTNGVRRPRDSFAPMETHVAHKILGCQVAGWWPRLSAPDLIAAGTFPAGRIAEDVQLSVAAFGPELILSPSSAELHAQHRLAAEVALILARPSAAYRPSLITFEVGRGVWWAGKPSMPTLIVDTSTTWRTKAAALRAYRSESQEWPDARSVRAVLDDDRALGTRAGVRYAEGFEIVRAFEGGLP